MLQQQTEVFGMQKELLALQIKYYSEKLKKLDQTDAWELVYFGNELIFYTTKLFRINFLKILIRNYKFKCLTYINKVLKINIQKF